MANTIKIKQSAVASKVPLTTDLTLGELAINTYDGKLFLKKNVIGTETIVEIGSGGGVSVPTVSATPPVSPVANSLWWDSTDGNLKIYYNDGNTSQWVDASSNTFGTGGTLGTGALKNISVSTAAPLSPSVGDLWVDTN